jgi:thioredoxin 1
MSAFHEITVDNFESDVLKSDKPVLLEFGAVWCGPCKMLDPVLEELAGELGDSILVAKVDVDHHPQIAGNYNILSVPTTMLFKDGEIMERLVGYLPKDRISAKIDPHLQPA